jgi:hypothetical protein
MPQTFKVKNSVEAGKVPSAGDLVTAELGLNLKDQKLYSKDADGNVFEIGTCNWGDIKDNPITIDGTEPSLPEIGDLWVNLGECPPQLNIWSDCKDPGNPEWISIVDIPPGTITSDTPPLNPEAGQLWWNSSDASGRLYVYYEDANSSQWVEASPPSKGFSGDYEDLTNKPNIPPEFNLDDGSYENDIIHWADLGSVQEISTTGLGTTQSGNVFSNVAADGGSGTGLTCNVIRRKGTGAHEVYIAVRGQDYIAGETVFLNLGYGVNNDEGINCTIDQVNEDNDGWVARPGKDYYISSVENSLNTGVPQFMTGAVFGGKESDLEGRSTEAPLNIYPIGDKNENTISYYGVTKINHNCYLSGSTSTISTILRGEKGSGIDYTRFHINKTGFTFGITAGTGTDSFNTVCRIAMEDGDEGKITLYKDQNGSSNNVLTLTSTSLVSGVNSGNSAFNFNSSNGKFNFKNDNGSKVYTINAENGSAGFVLPEDVALASNYDAEGEYIGPVQDRVADLIARVNAIESNEISDDAVDSALLTLVASLTTRLDERDLQIAALTTRIAALEGA